MDYALNYINELMINQPIDTDYNQQSDFQEYNGHGGGKSNGDDINLGGFPPIFICDKKSVGESPFADANEKQKREYSKLKTTVSIQSIMKERQKKKPFFDMSRAQE